MTGVVRLAAAISVIVLLAGASAYAQESGGARSDGRRLDEALGDLQRRGLKIIYSSEVVRPDMRVRAEPRVTSLRRILDELLSPHGLIARNRPGGTVLVVKNPRARLAKGPASQIQSPSPGAERDAVEQPRFEETIRVTDALSRGAGIGPSPFAVAPSECEPSQAASRTSFARCMRSRV